MQSYCFDGKECNQRWISNDKDIYVMHDMLLFFLFAIFHHFIKAEFAHICDTLFSLFQKKYKLSHNSEYCRSFLLVSMESFGRIHLLTYFVPSVKPK